MLKVKALCLLALLTCKYGFAASFDPTTPVQVNVPTGGVAVPQFSKLELQVNLVGAPNTAPDCYNPAKLDLSATFVKPDGVTSIKVNGFFNGVNWLVRFAPDVTGVWNYTVAVTDPNGSATSPQYSFQCSASTNPGFAQLNGHFIQFSGTKKAYFAVGHNNGWQTDVEKPSLAQMAANGENLLSFWLAQPWGTPGTRAPLENVAAGLSNYDQTACAYIDGVVQRAEAANVYLLPSIWAHDQLCSGLPSGWPASWSNNAYSTITDANGFYQTADSSTGLDTPQWTYQQNYYRYLLARWGYSRAIVGWVGVVEIDGTTGWVTNSAQATQWIGKVKSFFAAHDPFRSAPYPLTVSKTDTTSSDAAKWNSGADLRSMDSYSMNYNNTNVASTIATQTATMWGMGQPCLDTEFGGDVTAGASQPSHLHNGIWAGTASGAAFTPLVWCDGGHYPLLTDPVAGAPMQNQLTYLSQFMNNLSYLGSSALVNAAPTFNNTSLRGWGMRTADHGFGWAQNYKSTTIPKNATVSVQNVNAGSYTVEFYNTWSSGSTPISTASVTVSSRTKTLTATIPTLSKADIAFKFYPVGSGAASRSLEISALIDVDDVAAK